jgi:aryl-phospho-beta-D-glucosidase BglC (GH1 family)
MDNNVNVQFFDHQDYNANPIHFWTKQTAAEGKWKRITVPFKDVLAEALKLNINSTFNFNDIDKLQFQVFWPGTYLLDDIRASKSPILNIDPVHLSSGIVTWESFVGAAQYTLEESTTGPHGPWQVVYTGPDALFITSRLTPSWLRVRWETEGDNNTHLVPYTSDWSDVVYYQPKPTLIKHAYLQQGVVDWAFIPQTNTYEIQEGITKNGPWTTIYQGGYNINPLLAVQGRWYRARGVELNSNQHVVEATDWSPALAFDTTQFIAAAGTVLREANGAGDEIILKGINLGNLLLIEPWMFFGDQHPLKQIFPDDWTIRKLFLERQDVQPEDLDVLLRTYQNAYLTEDDLNDLLRMGGNFVRLPIHYLNIRETDETGQWAGNGFNFEAIDRIIQMCADRGIGVLLDLHGAPGSQSKEFHTGRASPPTPPVDGFYHQLFNPNDDTYRQRTVELWTEIARRYKDNPVVVGYDILNEPFGVLDPVYYSTNQDGYLALWSLYDRIYDAIRDPSGAGDTHHLIVMEGIPSARDWESLPNPSSMGWQNVAYEVHYYGFTFDPQGNINGTLDPAGHIAYLNDKVTYSRQSQYQVPVLIGEFNGFNQRANWNYYCQVIRNQGWSWSMWSNKTHDAPSEWGIYNHSRYDEDLPDFRIDSVADLQRKLSKYATLRYHTANESMREIVMDGFDACPALPDLSTSIAVTILPTEAVNAGAQWRLINGPDTSWKNSGQSIQGLTPGTYTVRFKNINGWQRPVQQVVQLTAFNNLQLQGTYTRNPQGIVTATIQPQAAINAGAQWRLTTGPDTNWKNSGDSVTVPAGNYTISFKKIRRFTKPSNISITVSGGQTISVTGIYL